MKTRTIVCTIITVVCLVSAVFAAPQKVNFQGKLTDAAGNPITASVSMVFSIYDHATSTNAVNKLWTETQTVAVTNGIYNVQLGQVNPIDTELTETKALWLGVKVGADAEMSPRVELTPGVYDLIILNAITVKDGKIGIGTSNPFSKLDVYENFSGGKYIAQFKKAGSGPGYINLDGGSAGGRTYFHFDSGFFGIYSSNHDQTAWYNLTIDGNTGRTSIGGTLYVSGADLAEPFDMTDIASLELGDVVVIDPLNPLHVTKSSKAYDTTVAGIVSSSEQAGYVAGSRSDGTSDKPIALVGRVLCNVSGENGAIKIGDLLTTSNTPGYAMKATDAEKRQGAVLGKALQAFEGEQGQILVLVTLQ